MIFESLWPLAFVLAVPIIIVLYLLVPKGKEYKISSNLLWKKLYQNQQSKTFLEKFIHNLLMYLQIVIILLLVLALMSPYIRKGGTGSGNVVYVLDTSGSMQHENTDGQTRLAQAVAEIKSDIAATDNGTFSIITNDGTGSNLLAVASSDKKSLYRLLDQTKATDTAGNLKDAVSAVQTLVTDAEGKKKNDVIVMTDGVGAADTKELTSLFSAQIRVMGDVTSNVSNDFLSYAKGEKGYDIAAGFTNYSDSKATLEVSLYEEKNVISVRQISIDAGESYTCLFEDVDWNGKPLHTEAANITFEGSNAKDSLKADNECYAIAESANAVSAVLVGKGNTYIEKAYQAVTSQTLPKSEKESDLDVKKDTVCIYDADTSAKQNPAVNRLVFAKEEGTRTAKAAKIEADKKATIKRFFTKQRQRRMYAAAKKEEKTVETLIKTQQNIVTKAAVVVKEAFIRNSKVFLILGMMGVFFLLISASLTSCTALMQGAGSSVVGTTYPSTDEDIYAVENRYRELEAGLNAQINAMRAAHPEYDDFRYQIDEISHNPYHLISYFTTKYGEFTYEQVKDELEEIFREQYGLTTSGERNVTVTETKKVRVGDSLGQVVTSGYCNCSICCGQWSGGPTASGVYPTAAHTIAVDSSTPFVPMGTHVVMNGVEYVVEDTGPLSRYGVQFDVYYDDHQVAQNHGHQTWEAYLADDNGTQEIEVTTTQTVNRYSVSLTNHNLDTVLRNRLTDDEKVRYALYNRTFGHRDYLFDLNSLPTYGGNGYTIPPEALSDERFARMIAEAEKHLGTPYVWGGYAPGGFDCSGFVSWVINHCGNGWDYGRLTAEGIRQVCAYVSPEEAKPGDIIFFQKTYDTEGASHVGIYVGDGMMIHCGKPVQYTTIHTDYWNSHFLQFGRLP